MNSIYPIIKPALDVWNRALSDPYMDDLEEFTAGGYGHDWNSKAVKREQNKFMGPYHMYQKRFKEDPKLSDVLEDNFNRLVVFCGLERLLTLR